MCAAFRLHALVGGTPAYRRFAGGHTPERGTKEPIGVQELPRLDQIAVALGERGAPLIKRLLVARTGFTAELGRESRRRGDVELVDLDRLYSGS